MEEENFVQVQDKSPSIEQTLHPIVFISWCLGVGVARPRKCSKVVTMILRLIHFGVCSVIMAYCAMDFFTFGNIFKSDVFKIMYYMNKMMCYVSAYYYIYHGIRQYNKWPKLMSKMKNLDQKIERETFVNDQPIKNIEVLAILATFACGPLSLIIHTGYYYFTRPENIFASDLLFYYTITQSLINNFIFDIIVYVLYHRLQTINELIVQLNKQISASQITRIIRRIRELYMEICDLIVMINDIYGFYLLLCSANCFTMVVTTLFRIHMSVVERNYAYILINNIFWILYVAQFGLMCSICTLLRQESDKTGKNINDIVLNYNVNVGDLNGTRNQLSLEVSQENQDGEQNSDRSSSYNLNYIVIENLLHKNLDILTQYCVRNEINYFFIQLQQHPVAITACNFFEMNNALLSAFVGVIITYLIILVQFYQPEHLDA